MIRGQVRLESSPIREHDKFADEWYAARARYFQRIRRESVRFAETHDVTAKEFWKKARARGRTKTLPGFATVSQDAQRDPWIEEHDAVLRLIDYVDRRRNDVEHSRLVSYAGLSAAHLLGLATVSKHPEKAERQVAPPHSSSSGAYSRTRHARVEPKTVVIAGLRVSTCAQTVVDVARWVGPADGLVAADFMLHEGLGTSEQVGEIVDGLRGARGIQHARAVHALMDPRVESPGESLARWRFYDAGLMDLEPQVWAHLSGASYRMDLFDSATGTNIEFDGLVKIANPAMRNGKSVGESLAGETRRQRELRQVGIQTFRLEWKDVMTTRAFDQWLTTMRGYGLPC